jgi:hypothetical protein
MAELNQNGRGELVALKGGIAQHPSDRGSPRPPIPKRLSSRPRSDRRTVEAHFAADAP